MHYTCPSCGKEVEVGKPCPGCPPPQAKKKRKRRARTRRKTPPRREWEQDSQYDGLDLPDESDWLDRPDDANRPRPPGLALHWKIAGLILLLVFIWVVIGAR